MKAERSELDAAIGELGAQIRGGEQMLADMRTPQAAE
jgi:hypothetical protein